MMKRALIWKEFRGIRTLFIAFSILAGLMIIITDISGYFSELNDDNAAILKLILLGVGLYPIYTLFIGVHLIASERRLRSFDGLAALPIEMTRIWRIKYLFGLAANLAYLTVLGIVILITNLYQQEIAAIIAERWPIYIRILPWVLLLYTCSFLAACLVRSELAALLVAVILFGIVGGMAAGLVTVLEDVYNFNCLTAVGANGEWGLTALFNPGFFRLLVECGIPLLAVAIVLFESWLYFRFYHRQLITMASVLLIIPALFCFVPVVYVPALAIIPFCLWIRV